MCEHIHEAMTMLIGHSLPRPKEKSKREVSQSFTRRSSLAKGEAIYIIDLKASI